MACNPGAVAQSGSPSETPSSKSAAGDGAKRILLRRKFASAQTNYYIVEREESSRMTMMMLRIPPTRRIMKDTWIERIKSVMPDGSANAEWTLDRAQYQRPSDKGDYSYDSAGDEPNTE